MKQMRGTLALSWGAFGGFYVVRGYGWRVCLGWIALTWLPVELDDLCRGYIAHKRAENEARALAPWVRALKDD